MVTRRLALSSLFHGKARDTPLSPTPPPATAGPWPSSKNPRAQSTRAARPQAAGATRTIASIVLDSAESSFTASSAARQDWCSDSLSTASQASAAGCDDDAADDAVVRGIRSDRLLFDPGASATNSILEEKSAAAAVAACAGTKPEESFGGAVAVAFESADPYADFRASMEEMVAAHGIGDWGWLEEMLGWYLRANDGDTHCAIVAAFIDVVVAIADPAREACSSQASSCTFAAGELDVAKGKPAAEFTVSCVQGLS